MSTIIFDAARPKVKTSRFARGLYSERRFVPTAADRAAFAGITAEEAAILREIDWMAQEAEALDRLTRGCCL